MSFPIVKCVYSSEHEASHLGDNSHPYEVMARPHVSDF